MPLLPVVARAWFVHFKASERDVEHLLSAPDIQGWVDAVAARLDGLRAVEGHELFRGHSAALRRFNQVPRHWVAVQAARGHETRCAF